jgi:uncharacterized lipoprotein YehR (DUF1307 family)
MKTIKKMLVVFVILFAFALSGCGTTEVFVPNWTNLYRVGPDAKVKLYHFDEESDSWILAPGTHLIPEGHYIAPSPAITD